MNNYKSEADLQAQCYKWFCAEFTEQRNRYFLIYNNPPNKVVAGMLKSMGLNRGIGDALYLPIISFDSVWFEFKIGSNKQSDPQYEFMLMVRARGHKYHLIREVSEFQEIILNLNR